MCYRCGTTYNLIQDASRRGFLKTSAAAAATIAMPAGLVGTKMAAYIKKAKITNVAFDRSGYRYHGRIKAVAEALRENGVKI